MTSARNQQFCKNFLLKLVDLVEQEKSQELLHKKL